MNYENFTSLPPEQEKQFVVFERQSVESSKKAFMIGAISGAVLFVFLVGVYLANDPPAAMHTEALEDDIGEEPKTPKRTKPAATPAPSEAPAATAPSGAAGGEAAAAPSGGDAPTPATPATPPAPPKGATKAPPSALVGQ